MSSDLTSVDSHGLAWSAAARLAQLLDAPNVDVYLRTGQEVFVCLARIQNGKPDHGYDGHPRKSSGWDAGQEAVRTQKAVFSQSNAPSSESAVPEDASHAKTLILTRSKKRTLVLPLISRGKSVGVVEVMKGRPDWAVTPDKLATAESVCRLIALSLQDAEALGAERALAGRLASMLESSRALASAETLEEGLAILVRQAADAMSVSGCVAYEHLREPGAIVAPAIWEETSTHLHKLGETRQLEDCPTERSVLASTRIVLENISDPALARATRVSMATRSEKTRLTVPMDSAGGAMGLLVFFDTRREQVFTDEDTTFAAGLAGLAGESVRSAQLLRRLKNLSITDPLTGLANHRHFHEMLEREHARAVRNETSFSLVMLDIDGFKLLNDTYGHPCGDDALRHVAAILQSKTRRTDVVGRCGGDEFVLVLPETDCAEADVLVQKLRETLTTMPFSAPTGDMIPIQYSFGIATYPEDGQEVNELVVAADTKLYASKRSGGNVVTGVGGEESDEPDLIENFGLLEAMLTAVDNKDRYTRRHSMEVTEYALALAAALNLSEDTLRIVRAAGLLHDVGKIAIPDRILRKPGRLTEAEYEIVKDHPSMGASLIRSMPDLGEINAAVISHHECFDGTGYPEGLVGTEIPLLARILAIADAYSAMTTDRPYRKALTYEKAITEVASCAGTQFDPEMVTVFLSCLKSQGSKAKPSRTPS
jgi:diguanylate cyclase (GGDEF)-like protein/putative nucleotidyltransferase with HDIG domain